MEETYHDPYRPTKHNLKCKSQSVCNVINQHRDFENLTPMNKTEPPETEFNILMPRYGRFVIVLGSSNSTGLNKNGRPHIKRLIEASSNFAKYYVRDGSQLGVTSVRYDSIQRW